MFRQSITIVCCQLAAALLVSCATAVPAAAPNASPGLLPSGPVAAPPPPQQVPTALPPPRPEQPIPPKRPIYILDPNFGSFQRLSRIIAIDPDRQTRTLGGKATRYAPDVAFSPDGRRMYVADSYWTQVTRGETRDALSVYDTLTSDILADDVPIPRRLKYKGYPMGQPFLFTSEDGSRLYVMKYGDPDVRQVRLAVLDAETLQTLGEGPYPPCGRRVQVLADRWVCVNSMGSVDAGFTISLEIVDLEGGVVLERLLSFEAPGPDGATAAVAPSADGARLYDISRNASVTIVDMPGRTVLARKQLQIPSGFRLLHESVALSPDEKLLYLGFENEVKHTGFTADEI